MSSTFETTLEWPRFCYSGSAKMEDIVSKAKATSLPPPPMPSGVRKRKAGQTTAGGAKQRRTAAIHKLPLPANFPAVPEPPKIPEFAFSDLMRKMASKYQTSEDKENNTEVVPPAFQPFLPFPALRGMAGHLAASRVQPPQQSPVVAPQSIASLLPFGLSPNSSFINPFALSALCGQNLQQQTSKADSAPEPKKDTEGALDLTSNSDNDDDDEVDILSVDTPSNIEEWSVSEVADFVNTIDTCQEYSEVFREHCIDGSGLVVLSESHMTRILGMKLGPVIRLKAAIAQLVRRQSTSPSSLASSA